MELLQLSKFGLEGAISVLILVAAAKFYRMKIATKSACCGEQILITTESIGANEPVNNLADLVA